MNQVDISVTGTAQVSKHCTLTNIKPHEQVQLQTLHIFSTDWNTMAQQYNGMHYYKLRLASHVKQPQDVHLSEIEF